MNRLNKLKISNKNIIKTESLVNFKGGIGGWDGQCGLKYNGVWTCRSAAEGFTYENVLESYESDEGYSGWCCASCSDESKCGPAEIAPV